jgi:hypothetical protein
VQITRQMRQGVSDGCGYWAVHRLEEGTVREATQQSSSLASEDAVIRWLTILMLINRQIFAFLLVSIVGANQPTKRFTINV